MEEKQYIYGLLRFISHVVGVICLTWILYVIVFIVYGIHDYIQKEQ